MAGVVSGASDAAFWRGRRVLLTGHTGFKGAWCARLLAAAGAEVTGIALDPEPGPSAFAALGVAGVLAADHRLDLREGGAVARVVRGARPEVVLHLAAQALVGRAHADPAGTFASNVTGTVHLLEALRGLGGVAAAVVVTSDKVYRNDGGGRRFAEADALGGEDPYSASKAAAEIAVASWRTSFGPELPPLATARAGNVIGGGDFAALRIVPDIVRAALAGEALVVRRPDATRPFQHVLDVLRGYLLLAEHLAAAPAATPPALNFGPADGEISVRRLLALWEAATGRGVAWRPAEGTPMPEAPRLALDSTLAARALGWRPAMDTQAAVAATARWYDAWARGEAMDAAGPALAATLRGEAAGA